MSVIVLRAFRMMLFAVFMRWELTVSGGGLSARNFRGARCQLHSRLQKWVDWGYDVVIFFKCEGGRYGFDVLVEA